MRKMMLVCALLSGCATAEDFAGPYTGRSGPTEYRVDDRPDGSFTVSVRQDVGRFWPHPAEMQETCRREATALAVEEGRRRGVRVEIDPRTTRAVYGRNPIASLSSCTGQAIAVPVR